MPGVGKSGINFASSPAMRILYDEVKLTGVAATRLISAGMVLLIADPDVRARAFDALGKFEKTFADADPDEIRRYVERKLQGGPRRSKR